MGDWPRWQLDGEALAVTRYVLPDEVGRLVRLPDRSGEGRIRRLRAVYEALAGRRIGYAFEASDEAGRQVIRPPDEVLWEPRHASCLDLALVLAGGCLKAGLHPVVVVLAPGSGVGPLHSVLLVRLDEDLAPDAGEAVWRTQPPDLPRDVQRSLAGPPARYLAVDPVGMAVSQGSTSTEGLAVDFADAVANGARHLAGSDGEPAWTWRLGVDIGRAWRAEDTLPVAAHPAIAPLRQPYRPTQTTDSPLRLLRAEHAAAPFQNRDELTALRDWCHEIASGTTTGLAVITGLGGSGKTRLALELAHRLRTEGWYAGVLPKDADGIDWLARVVSPLLVVLDDADGRVADATTLLKAVQGRQGPPAVVLLTARSTDGDWLPTIENSLADQRHVYRGEIFALPGIHPDALDVYHGTVAALTTEPVAAPPPPRGTRWTTLDLVLLGWVAANGAATLPASHAALYEQVLVHEVDYWCAVHQGEQPELALLRKAAACVSLVAPDTEQAYQALAAVGELADDAAERRAVLRTLITCLSPAPGEGLAARPDPIGDHLVLTELSREPALLLRTLERAGEPELARAVITLTRAGQNDPERAQALITTMLQAQPHRWSTVLSVARAIGGAAAAGLAELAVRPDRSLPLDDLSHQIPASSVGLYDLGLTIDLRRLELARQNRVATPELAELLLQVSARAVAAGDRAAALASVAEAVDHYRLLAAVNPAAFLADLAGSLNNLAVRQSESGDRAGALASVTEAVDIRRQLVAVNPTAFLADLAGSLNNLSNRQSETGDRAGALASVTEAVDCYRGLAATSRAAFLPDLAGSLNNLSVQQSETGDRAGALASITEAVDHYRLLAAANPAAFLPDLAGSLNNLSVQQSETGDRIGALASVTEAVDIRRRLAASNPAAFLPDLAGALNNLSNRQSETGDRAGALVSVTEAVDHYRRLAAANPAAFLPDLATSLNNLSNRQSETGDQAGALASIIEAVDIRRRLAAGNPAAFLPDLAASLNNLSLRQSGTGDRASALTSITEAVDIRRRLAARNPAAFLPDLAASLNNLSNRQSETGDRSSALASITEAVYIRRQLAAANPAAFLPNLATSLNNLSNRQSETGDQASALASITEAVDIRRRLAARNPAAFLPNLATSLNNFSLRQSEHGDRAGALASITEAVHIRRRLAASNPAAFLADLAGSLNNLSLRQGETGDRAGALASITEAVDYYRRLATSNPAAFLPYLAGSLNNLSLRQSEAGDHAGALASVTEAVEHYRRLAAANPAAFLPDLAASLSNLLMRPPDSG